jgi:uncharacterized protein YyaL (SSP411 family)
MPNRLANEKSPYLRQHSANPVDWYPWGEEALQKARAEDRPILVSIGYSACHWCHVMAHESFENLETARLMNEAFVNIKVDREERPDVDAVYMEAVQAMTGQGGWPLNAFLAPDGRPFYGGTYFPPRPGHGLPSWPQVIESVSRAYRERRTEVLGNAGELTKYIRESQMIRGSGDPLTTQALRGAFDAISGEFDWTSGGFGGAPKFPQPLALEIILRLWRRWGDERALRFVQLTLDRMSAGGIFDQLGGGFHRYTVDARWVVPHFEKMLYDNALLANVYALAWQATHEVRFRKVAEQTLDYLLRDMRAPGGGFYSALDADSEGVEGEYYVWTPEELRDVLGADAEIAELRFGVRAGGNFEGRTILTNAMSVEEIAAHTGRTLEDAAGATEATRRALLTVRSQRVAPSTDTKILAAWNALAVRALAEAGRSFNRPEYVKAASEAADFVLDDMSPDGKLVRSFDNGPGEVPAFLEDYAYMVEALITLYEASFDSARLAQARRLAGEMIELFQDRPSGLLFDAQGGDGSLIVRPRNLFDNPVPSGNSAAAFGLLRLEAITGEQSFGDVARDILGTADVLMQRAPLALGHMLSAADFHLTSPLQIAISGNESLDRDRLVERVFRRYLPNRVLSVGLPGESPLLEGRVQIDGRPTAYVCEHFSCRPPVTETDALDVQLDQWMVID